MENRVKFRVGEIEFEAEGTEEFIEKERSIFLKNLLPAGIDALAQTRNFEGNNVIDMEENVQIENSNSDIIQKNSSCSINFDRMNLTAYLNSYGDLSESDFVLFSAYFDEKKNKMQSFTTENVKQYYTEARRKVYSNVSELVKQLVKKGLIMDDTDAEKKKPKPYIITMNGIKYIEEYESDSKVSTKRKPAKSKGLRSKLPSVYTDLTTDDLHLENYPKISALKNFKDQMILISYIVLKENKGDTFSANDIEFLLTDLLGVNATTDQISGVFKNHKSWFKPEKDPVNKKVVRRKLMQSAKDYAEEIIKNAS